MEEFSWNFAEFIRNSVEFQGWGLNVLTGSFLATFFSTLIQGYGLIEQGKQIWKQKSSKSISLIYFSYMCFFCLSFMLYGFNKNSLAMIFSSLLGFLCFPILAGLWKFKKINFREIISSVAFTFIIPGMFYIQNKDIYLSVILFGAIIFLVIQVREMFLAKSRGAMSPKFLFTFLINSGFWLIYATAIGNWPLQVFNTISIILFFCLLSLYFKYRERE